MNFFKRLNFLLSPAHKKELVVLTVFLFIGMLLETGGIGVLLPALTFLLNGDSGKGQDHFSKYFQVFGHPSHNTVILIGLGLLIVFYLVKSLFLIYSSYRQVKFTNNLSVDLSHDLYNGYLRMPYAFHLQRNSSELQRNIQIEILHFGGISMAAMTLATEFTTIFGISVLLICLEPLAASSVILFFGFFSFLFNRTTNKRIAAWGYQRQHYDGEANKHLLEGLGGVKQVKLSHLETFFLNKFTGSNQVKSKFNKRIQVLATVPRLYLELLAIAGVALIVIMMMAQGKPLSMLVPVLGIFVAAAFRLIPSINKIINSIQTINYAESVTTVLTREFEMIRRLPPPGRETGTLSFEQSLVVNDLNFSYESAEWDTLSNINVHVNKGEFIGFIGSTGSGKSTLIDMIVGLLSPRSGTVLVDGVNVEGRTAQWQNMIGYVPQTIYLTDDSLRRNIAFGIPDDLIDESRVQHAMQTAQLGEFINNLPAGLDTVVGERGIRLSGGERQRIGIARALYHDPPVLILDEATSSLDIATEKEFMQSVNSLQGIKTILIVAHRLTTVEKCDRVYELKKGVIVREINPALI